jgi:hypothetical protein
MQFEHSNNYNELSFSIYPFVAENFNLKKTHYGGGCLEIMIAKEKNIL